MIQKIIQSSYFYTLSIGLHIAILFTLLISVDLKPPVTPPTISASVYFETPKKVVVLKKIITPPKTTKKVVTKTKKVTPPAKKVTPPAKKVTPPAEKVTPPAKKVTPKTEKVTPPAEKVTTETEKVTTETKKPEIVKAPFITKPDLQSINSQNLPINDNISESLELTSENTLNLKGFLRANQLTQKPKFNPKNNAPVNNIYNSSPVNKSVKASQKFKIDPLAKTTNPLAKITDSEPQQQIPDKPTLTTEKIVPTNKYDDLLAEMGVDTFEGDDSVLSNQWSERTEKKVFQKSLYFQISEHWVLPPIALPKFQVVVAVIMNDKGQIKKIDFLEYAPVAIINIAVERTLRRAEPFENVPDSMLLDNGEYKATFRFSANQVAN